MAVFELGGALAPELSELAIGPWMSTPMRAPMRAPEIAAFDAGAGPAESLWRVGLERDDAVNRAALARGERSIAHAHAVLDDIPRRLDRALAAVRPDLSSLSALEPGRFEQALLRAGDLARGRARIETRVEGTLVARTLTMSSGDIELWIAPGLSSASAALHARSVAVTLRTRHAWARILALAFACASRIAALGTPAAVAALPAAWRLLRDLLREVCDPAPRPRGGPATLSRT